MITIISWFLSISGCATITWALLGGVMALYQRTTNPVLLRIKNFLWLRFFKAIFTGVFMIIVSIAINKFLA